MLRQNDPRWGARPIGASKVTIGRAGCLLTDLAMAKNLYEIASVPPKVITPIEADAICVSANAYQGALLLVERAAKALGMRAPESERLRCKKGDPRVPALVREVLLKGGFAVVHVDHDSTLPDGDPEGDHFVLAFRLVKPDVGPEHFECADPAPGRTVWLDTKDCMGTCMWGSTLKTYRAVGVIPLWRSA